MARRGIAVVLGAVVIMAGGVVALYATEQAPWEPEASQTPMPLLTPTARAEPGWQVADDVLGGVAESDPDEAARLADALSAELSKSNLDVRVGAYVIDVASGDEVYSLDGDKAMTPASVQKILTSAAALSRLGPDHVFTTRVVTGNEDLTQLTLVGGGDPMLRSTEAAGFTALDELAEATAEQVKSAGASSVSLGYDDSLFQGPSTDDDWEPGYVSEGIVAPVSALSVDGGRVAPGSRTRAADPAAAAAATFANMLKEHGVDVRGDVAKADVSADGTDIAAVSSPPVAEIVEYLIATSNNDVAENLGRHVASASGLAASPEDVETAVSETLADLGIDVSGIDVRDGSGLSRQNAVAAATIVEVLSVAAADEHPELRAVLTGLPIAGYTGTLAERFAAADSAVGMVRAKTGTLTAGGVHSLAGVAISEGGSAYAFAVVANDVSPGAAIAVRNALDAITSTLAE
jgi:D-alanyl-D-alanine carboxypeptidase/D-alanyl-D-alanine-endopeptidase (penicillin-binding protein 4)